mgnify:CR=1 FL=1
MWSKVSFLQRMIMIFVTNGSCTEGTIYGDQNHAPNGDAEVPYQWCMVSVAKISQLRILPSDIRKSSAQTFPEQTGNPLLSPLWMTVLSPYITNICQRDPRTGKACYRWYRKLPGFQVAFKLDHQPSGTIQGTRSEEGLCMGLRTVHRCSR